jgi:hypothetical protein
VHKLYHKHVLRCACFAAVAVAYRTKGMHGRLLGTENLWMQAASFGRSGRGYG